MPVPPNHPDTLLRFGLFEVDLRSCELRKQGHRVKLQEQPFRILATLLQRPGELVTREELRLQLWPSDTFVDFDNGLNASINKLREALGDSASNPRWIETVPRHGYRFVATLEGIGSSNQPLISNKSFSATLLKLIVGAGAGITVILTLHLVTRSKEPTLSFEKMKLRQLTNTGNVREAAISPDGKYVAYVVESDGRDSIWMRQVATTSAVQIVAPGYEPSFANLAFSPDGNFLLYRHVLRLEGTGQLETVAVLGSTPKKLNFDVDESATFSPDGRQIAFVRHDPPSAESWLVVTNSDGSSERILVRHSLADLFRSPAWSPDGKFIAFASGGFMPQSRLTISYVSVSDGKEKSLTSPGSAFGDLSLAWLGDGSGLVITGRPRGQANDAGQVWFLPFPSGEPRRITNDLSNYGGVGVTRDSQSLITVRKEWTSAIWLVPTDAPSRARQVTFTEGRADGLFGLCWTPDGRIAYSSRVEGTSDLWLMEADGGKQQQLTANASFNADPVAFPDGRSIIFTSSLAGGNHLLWRIEIDGGNARQLTHGRDEFQPAISPDGRRLVYASTDSGKTTVWEAPLEGGKPVQLEKQLSWFPAISPDGAWLAYVFFDEEKPRLKISFVPMAGRKPTRVVNAPAAMGSLELLRWTVDGRALSMVETRDGVDNIWNHPLSGEPPKQLTNFSSGQIFAFDWSLDGKQLAVARGSLSSDVVLINNFR